MREHLMTSKLRLECRNTIKLGLELSDYTNEITDVYITKDYSGILINEYLDHVRGEINGFSSIVKLLNAASVNNFSSTPYELPLNDIGTARKELGYILDNKKAYRSVIKSLLKHCSRRTICGRILNDFLTYLMKPDSRFKSKASTLDRYIGEYITTAGVIKAIYEYGRLSGLVDYYNMEDLKDGQST